jgi:tRNA modification GTPase
MAPGGAGIPASVVYTKCDQAPAPPGAIGLSSVSGEGVDRLLSLLTDFAGAGDGAAGTFSARARHVEALGRAAAHVTRAREAVAALEAPELVAEELRLAGTALGEITGEVSSDDLLGAIFSTFCIGK